MEIKQPKITRQKRKRLQTHSSIMHNAKKLFEDRGLGNVTIEEITEAADVSRSTFFSHFASLEALSTEIAGVAIEDILDAHRASGKSGIEGIYALIDKLIDDTCPYPYLSVELLTNGIVKSKGKTPFYYLEKLIKNDLSISEIPSSKFNYEEQVAVVLGAYFGLVFQKLIRGNPFDNPDEMKLTIRKIIISIIGGNQ